MHQGEPKSHGEEKQKCPTKNQMLPCKCRDKKNGLDIVCEKVNIDQLRDVTSLLKAHNQAHKTEYNVSRTKLLEHLYQISSLQIQLESSDTLFLYLNSDELKPDTQF